MKLSLKQKAFIQAVGVVILSVFAGVTVTTILSKIPAEAVPYIAIAALLGMAVNFMYNLRLSSLEYKEKLKEMTKKD
jgi:cytochrome c biogenesis protein CcdA